ncbi:MAG: xanthine dehydrogenase family protein molybdopterin-binding subunit, partial [Anaerolineales bacterium]|nr:xanthine dehydrogenase family protein molybdopterin-binding subunit [Anaerolineales bacterium]
MSEVQTPPKRKWRLTRRGFLIGAGVTGFGLAVGIAVGRRPFYRFVAGMLDKTESLGELENDPFAWFELNPDNTITVYISKVEMGQGVHTALAQIAAEELGVRWDQLKVQQAGTLNGPADGSGTGNSGSVTATFNPLRQAGALMREMLTLKAAEKMGLPAADLEAKEATVRAQTNPEKSMTYSEIAAGVSEWPEVDVESLSLKPASEFEFIGRSLPRVDFADKLTGQATYGYDARLEGMLYGAVARPRTIGATMISASAGDAESRPGVVKVVIDEAAGFAGVVAQTRQQAQAAVRALEIEWDEGQLWQQDELEALLSFENGREGYEIQGEGNASRVIGNAPTLTAEYFTPFAIHAHLEPQAAVADVQGESVTIYGSTQSAGVVQGEIAEITGFAAENINVTPTYLGGGFGRRLNIEAAVEATRLSQAAGVPVHVGWSRTEDMRYGYYRPPTRSQLSAKLANGRVSAIEHKHASGP